MALSLFARQATIGLEVPEWVTLIVTPVTDEFQWSDIKEVLERVAVVGAHGATVVLVGASAADQIEDHSHHTYIREQIAEFRPWFEIVLCNAEYYLTHLDALGSAPRVVLRSRDSRSDLSSVLPPGPALLLDLHTTAVGWCSNIPALLAELDVGGAVEEPWALPHWSDCIARQLLLSLTEDLAVNLLCKPSLHPIDQITMAAEFADHVTAAAFNERGLRARWQPEPTETAA